MDEIINHLKQELELKQTVRESKRQLQYHKMAIQAVKATENHMKKVPLEVLSSADFTSLTLTCEELANAQFLLQNCKESPMSTEASKVCILTNPCFLLK